tara:strand:+ start:249 stop:389 length:141 start_codon:yes stop_codon:yes gene_type:complete
MTKLTSERKKELDLYTKEEIQYLRSMFSDEELKHIEATEEKNRENK